MAMMRTTWLWLILTVLAGLALGWEGTRTPAAVPASAPADRFAAGRAMADVRALAAAPRLTGTPGNAAGRAYLVRRLDTLGFAVREVRAPLTGRFAQRLADWGGNPASGSVSLVAIRPGRNPALPLVALMAHHDSVAGSPGAADDAAGVAAALEVARAIPAEVQQRDLAIILTDAEELGLVGARALFDTNDPVTHRIGVLINLEARGAGGRAMMFETGRRNGALMRLYQRVVDDPTASSLSVTLYERLPNGTDFTAAKDRGVQGLNFAFIDDAALYHSPLATPDRLDRGALQHMGDQALAVSRALLTAAELPGAAPDLVFATVPWGGMIAYPPAWGWALVGVAAGLIGLAAWWRRTEWTVLGTAIAVGEGLLALLLVAGLLTGLNIISGAPGEYYDRLAALPRLEAQALLQLLAVLMVVAAGLTREPFDRWLGLMKLILVAAILVQWLLPGGGPLFTWPLLLGSAAMAFAAAPSEPLWRPTARIATVLAAIIGIGLLFATGHFVLLGLGADLPAAIAPLFLAALALLAPLLPAGPRRPALLAAGLLLAAALALALWVRLDPPAPTAATYAGLDKQRR